MRRYHTLIQARDLMSLLKDPHSVHIVEAGVDAEHHYSKLHIPTAQYFDIGLIANPNTQTPPMLPSEPDFNSHMQRLGIPNDSSQLVCYDRGGLISASRVWWTFKTFGRKHVSVLDGGLPAWVAAGLPTAAGAEPKSGELATPYTLDKKLYKSLHEIVVFSQLLNMTPPQALAQIIDARPPGVFAGLESYDKVCNIPGSKNLFYRQLMTEDGKLKSNELLLKEFKAAGVDMSADYHTIHSCRSGQSACVNMLAMVQLGKTNCSVYDGSWSEFSNYLDKQKALADQ
jgi:thiosulfate/3-mercaptopyruvate sulfurtransferase